ncbi:retrovirus-related pol polyprotein from transposon TNT 1-94 [Tanacetum coccineum]
MKAEDCALLDRQALGAVRLSLAKNVAYNIINKNTSYGLFKALSNMYKKPSASNKVFLIRQLVNTKMKKEPQFAERGTVTAVSGSTGSTKLKFDNIRDLILGEDIRRKTSGEYSNSLDKKLQKTNGAGDYNNALVCCIENTIEDRIMDSGASFHATYCKEELERFKLRSGKGQRSYVALRLGHMSEKGMKILASKGRIPDLEKAVVGFCEPCVLGKQTKFATLRDHRTVVELTDCVNTL